MRHDELIFPNLNSMNTDRVLAEYFKCLRRLGDIGSNDWYVYGLAELRMHIPFIYELDEVGHKLIGNVRAINDLEDKVWDFLINNQITELPKTNDPIITLFRLQVCK